MFSRTLHLTGPAKLSPSTSQGTGQSPLRFLLLLTLLLWHRLTRSSVCLPFLLPSLLVLSGQQPAPCPVPPLPQAPLPCSPSLRLAHFPFTHPSSHQPFIEGLLCAGNRAERRGHGDEHDHPSGQPAVWWRRPGKKRARADAQCLSGTLTISLGLCIVLPIRHGVNGTSSIKVSFPDLMFPCHLGVPQ